MNLFNTIRWFLFSIIRVTTLYWSALFVTQCTSEKIHNRAIVTMDGECETVPKLSNDLEWVLTEISRSLQRHFQGPWTSSNPYFKVTPFFDAEYLRNGTINTDIVSLQWNTKWTHAHIQMYHFISNYLEWLSEIVLKRFIQLVRSIT